MEAINIQKQRPEVFYKKDFLKKFAILTGKHLCLSLFLIKLTLVQVLPVKITKILRTSIFKNICERVFVVVSLKIVLFLTFKYQNPISRTPQLTEAAT